LFYSIIFQSVIFQSCKFQSPELGFTAMLSSFFFFFFVAYRSLNGTQPKSATCSEVYAIWKCMWEIWGIPSPIYRGPKTLFFRRLRDVTATLTTYIFRTKHGIHNRQVRWQLQGSPTLSKYHEIWSTNGFKLDRGFYPPYVNSAFYFIFRLPRRTPANGSGTEPHLAKRWTVNRANGLV